MMGKSHRLGAALAGMGAAVLMKQHVKEFQPISGAIILAAGSIIGGYLSDADTPNSHIGRKWGIFLWPLWLVQGIIKIVCQIPGPFKKQKKLIYKLAGHRGIAHLPAFWILLAIITSGATWLSMMLTGTTGTVSANVLLPVSIYNGIFSHILLDAVFGGVMLLFPISTKRIKLSPFKTGGVVEYITCIAMAAGLWKIIIYYISII